MTADPSPEPVRALIYGRVSQDPNAISRSTAEQVTEGRAWADREGWTVTGVVEETGSASSYARRDRPAWTTVVEAIDAGQVDVLITWESSRATRQLPEYLQLRAACIRQGVRWAYGGTVYDLSRREDRFRTALDTVLAEDEAARTSERVRRAVRARALEGRPHGRPPYGYRYVRDTHTGHLLRQEPDPDTAPVVHRIYTRAAAGDTLYRIAQDLKRDGIPTPRPTKYGWQGSTLVRMVRNPANKALRVHRGVVVGPAQWEPLVSDELWDAANARLDDPARTKRPDSTVRYLLSGIATCGICHGPMYIVRPRGYATYTCKRASCVARSQRLLEAYVTDRVLQVLATRTDLGRPLDDDTVEAEARAELDALQRRLDGFTTAAADGDLSPVALGKIETRLLPQIRAAERRLRALRLPAALAGMDLSDPPALWESSGIAERRKILKATVTVTVHRAPRGRRVILPGTVDVTPTWATS